MSEALAAVNDYKEALSELEGNDKKQISLLTILAEDYADFSDEIVRGLKETIVGPGSDPKRKLAILYVIDSIIKNIPIRGNYRDVFAQEIVPIFVTVFKEGDERIRAALYKLRCTWKGIFPQSKLRKLDLEVKSIDKNWPLVEEPPPTAPIVAPHPARPPVVNTTSSTTAASSTTTPTTNSGNGSPANIIHVNPKFFNNGVANQPTAPPAVPTLKPVLKKPTVTGPTPAPILKKPVVPEPPSILKKPAVVADPRASKGTIITVPPNGKRVVNLGENRKSPSSAESVLESKSDGKELADHDERMDVDSPANPVATEKETRKEKDSRKNKPVIKTEIFNDDDEAVVNKKHKKEKKEKSKKDKKEKDYEKSEKKMKRKKSKEILPEEGIKMEEEEDLEGNFISITPPPVNDTPKTSDSPKRSRETSESSISEVEKPEEKRPRYNPSGPQDMHNNMNHGHQKPHHPYQNNQRRNRFDRPMRGGPRPDIHPGAKTTLLPTPGALPTPMLGSHAFAAPPQAPLPMPIVSAPNSMGMPTNRMPPSVANPALATRMPIPPPGIVVPNPISGLPPGLIMPPMMPGSAMPIPIMPPMMPAMISNETTRLPNVPANNRIFVDGKAYEVIHVKDEHGREIAVIERNGLPHKIAFSGDSRQILIDGTPYEMKFGELKTFFIDGEPHILRYGAPSRELYIGDYPFKGAFGGAPIIANINGKRHEIRLCGPPPEVKIEQDPSYDLIRFVNEWRMKQQQHQMETKAKEEKKDNEMEVKELLAKLTKSGILKQLTKKDEPAASTSRAIALDPTRGASPPVPSNHRLDVIERRSVPSTAMKDFNMRAFFYRYDSVIQELHRERILCSTCFIEFKERGEAYQLHLDEHLRDMVLTNNKGYSNRSRPYYMSEDDWANYSELDHVHNLPNSKKGIQKGQNDMDTATNDDVAAEETEMKECYVCNEAFEQYWDDDDDVWKLKDCVIQNGKAYHRSCLADATTTDQTMEEDPVDAAHEQEEEHNPESSSEDQPSSIPIKIDTDFLTNVINQANRV